MEELKKQVMSLQLKKEQDELVIAHKTQEIQELQRFKISQSSDFGLPSPATDFCKADESLDFLPPSQRASSKRPFVRSHTIAGSTSASYQKSHIIAGPHSSSKSIWTPIHDHPLDFGFGEVISQVINT